MVKKLNRIFLLIAFVLGLSNYINAGIRLSDKIQLSDSAYITLLTCDPGNALYSAFGHSAVRVVDYKKQLNIVFNYGTFSFSTSNFYLKFAAGKLNYKLSVSSYSRFLRSYDREGRLVIEQRLNLSQNQKQQFFDALLENYKPENREYQYDFFFDNCATRITDILEYTMKDSLTYNPSGSLDELTFRNLIDKYLVQGSWSDFGIDIALGSIIDGVASEREQTFLPHFLSDYLDRCEIGNEPLVAETKIILPDEANFKRTPFLISPPFIFWFIFVLILAASIYYRNSNWIIADCIIFSTLGLLGVVVLLLWFATNHDATAGNINFIWANPLFIIYTFYINFTKNTVIKYSSLAFFVVNIVVLTAWNLFPQAYNFVFIPIIGVSTIRLLVHLVRNWR